MLNFFLIYLKFSKNIASIQTRISTFKLDACSSAYLAVKSQFSENLTTLGQVIHQDVLAGLPSLVEGLLPKPTPAETPSPEKDAKNGLACNKRKICRTKRVIKTLYKVVKQNSSEAVSRLVSDLLV